MKKERKKKNKRKTREHVSSSLSLNRRGIRNFCRAFLWLPNKPPSESSSPILFHGRFRDLPERTSDDLFISLAGNRSFGRFLHTLSVKLPHRVNLCDSQRHLLSVQKKKTEKIMLSQEVKVKTKVVVYLQFGKYEQCCILRGEVWHVIYRYKLMGSILLK